MFNKCLFTECITISTMFLDVTAHFWNSFVFSLGLYRRSTLQRYRRNGIILERAQDLAYSPSCCHRKCINTVWPIRFMSGVNSRSGWVERVGVTVSTLHSGEWTLVLVRAPLHTNPKSVPNACNLHELIRSVRLLNYLCSFASALFGANCSAYPFEVQRTEQYLFGITCVLYFWSRYAP